jgi:hypothetical protein
LLAGGFSLLAGCNWDGHFSVLGYTTRPNFDEGIRTVYVPIFKNKAFQTAPYRGMEKMLTEAVIRQIHQDTPFMVISEPSRADTELLGTIITLNKNLLNRTQLNEVRQGEVVAGVELVWRDLRTGKVLSNPRKPLGVTPAGEIEPFDPDNPPLREGAEKPVPVLVLFSGQYLPEIGESNVTAQQKLCNNAAKQIVHMMEKDWVVPPKPCP